MHMIYAIRVTLLVTCQSPAWTNTRAISLDAGVCISDSSGTSFSGAFHRPRKWRIKVAYRPEGRLRDEWEIERSSSRPAGPDARGWSGSKITIITKKLLAPIGDASLPPPLSLFFFPSRLASSFFFLPLFLLLFLYRLRSFTTYENVRRRGRIA